MTPKEKAIELTDKMFNTQNSPCTWKGAKICALIAVDLHLEELSKMKLIYSYKEIIEYWEEVRTEIEKL